MDIAKNKIYNNESGPVATIPLRKKWKEKENEEMIVAGNAIYAIA